MPIKTKFWMLAAAGVMALSSFFAGQVQAQDDCKSRGTLDVLYCDEDGDLVADPPKDPSKFRNPSTLVFTYTPVEDPAVYENILKPFTDHLAKVTGKRVVYYQVQSNAAEIEAMLGRHPAVIGSGVIGRPDEKRGQVPVAFVLLDPERRDGLTEAALAEWCRANMATYKGPEIRFVDSLPMTATGKVKKEELGRLLTT